MKQVCNALQASLKAAHDLTSEMPVQSQLEKTKADYERRVEAIKQEAEELRAEIASLQAAKAELEAAQAKAESSIQQARDEAAQKVRDTQVGPSLQPRRSAGMTQMLDQVLLLKLVNFACCACFVHGTIQTVR